MQKKFHSSLSFKFFLFFLFLFLQILEAKEVPLNEDKAFYAITSLKYHLNNILYSSSKEKSVDIHFDESDISYLWQSASSFPSIREQIEEAQLFYDDSFHYLTNESLSTELREKSLLILQNLWQELNPYILKERAKTYAEFTPSHYPNFDDHPFITQTMRKQMRPYLLPLKHPLKIQLDNIFQPFRVIENELTFSEAGFFTLHHQPFSGIRVARHSDLKNYLVKVYLDSDPYEYKKKACWLRLKNRCIGAKNVRDLIKRKKLIHFIVPDKWLYPLSPTFPINHSKKIQPVILVVTDMDIVSLDESTKAWQYSISHRHLDELYCILSHGFASGYLNLNIPYCKNGKFACVDTENPKKEVDLEKVKLFLSPDMHPYWDKLVRRGGKI